MGSEGGRGSSDVSVELHHTKKLWKDFLRCYNYSQEENTGIVANSVKV